MDTYNQTITKSVLWDVTWKCNLRCAHCYNADYWVNQKSVNIEDNYQRIVDRLKDLQFNHIHLLGGEPLCEASIFDLIEYAVSKDIIMTINTNGTLLSEQTIKRLIDLGVKQVTVSLDGAVAQDNDAIRGKGVFERVVSNLSTAAALIEGQKSQMILQVATVITGQNVANIHKMSKLLAGLNVKYLDVLKLYECGNALTNGANLILTPKEYIEAIGKMLIEAYRNGVYLQIDCKPKVLEYINARYGFNVSLDSDFNKCEAGRKLFYMDQVCDMFPCGPIAKRIKRNELKEEMKISLFDAEAEEKMKLFGTWICTKASTVNAFCKECKHALNCSGCAWCQGGEDLLCREAVKLFGVRADTLT